MRRGWCVFTLGLAVGCGSAERRTEDARAPQQAVRDHMKQHVARSVDVRDWIIAGDLERTRESAMWLAVHDPRHSIPQEWIDHELDLRVVASDLAQAGDLRAASRALSDLARTCGACHEASGVQPRLAAIAPALSEDHAGRVMSQHEWAAGRMWEGLYAPSDRAWNEGARALRTPMQVSDIAGFEGGGETLVELESEVLAIAARARTVHEAADRAELYADLIDTCSRCHGLVAEL